MIIVQWTRSTVREVPFLPHVQATVTVATYGVPLTEISAAWKHASYAHYVTLVSSCAPREMPCGVT